MASGRLVWVRGVGAGGGGSEFWGGGLSACVGRVGGLAVVLGVGAAVVAWPGAVVADTAGSAGSAGTFGGLSIGT